MFDLKFDTLHKTVGHKDTCQAHISAWSGSNTQVARGLAVRLSTLKKQPQSENKFAQQPTLGKTKVAGRSSCVNHTTINNPQSTKTTLKISTILVNSTNTPCAQSYLAGTIKS